MPTRTELLILTNDRKDPLLLSLEPMGEQVLMQPGETYEILSMGPTGGSTNVVFASGGVSGDYIAVYADEFDSAIFHNGRHVAGFYPSEWPALAERAYEDHKNESAERLRRRDTAV